MSREKLYLRGSTWWCWGYDARGKRWHASTHQKDKVSAKAIAVRIERERAVFQDSRAARLTLEEALKLKRDALIRAKRSPETLSILAYKGGHLMRVWGADREVARLTLADTTAYVDHRLKEGAHLHSIQKEIRMLTESLHVAKRLGLYYGDPATLRPPELKGAYKPRETTLTPAECERLIAELGPKQKRYADRRPHVIAFLQLGVRKGELFKILSEHVDLERRTVWIAGTKTDSAARVIPLSATAVETFRSLLSAAEPGKPLFSWWGTGTSDRDLKKACKRAGIPVCSFNDLRRTFCSSLANAGVSETIAARLMGHNGTEMVRRIYTRIAAETMHSAIDRLPALTVTGVVTDYTPNTCSGASSDTPESSKTSPNTRKTSGR